MVHVLVPGLLIGLAMAAEVAESAAGRLSAPQLIELAKSDPSGMKFREALVTTLGESRIQSGTAVAGEGASFIWAIETAGIPQLIVDDEVRPDMTQIAGTDLWFEPGKLETGKSHSYFYLVQGKRVGGDVNLPAYGPDSYEQAGAPKGTLSPMITQRSRIYDGMESHYWIYVPAQYDPKVPAAVMVWNDGGGHVGRNGDTRTQIVIDNLTAQKKIPVMIQVFIDPGDISAATGTSTFDFVSNFSHQTGRTMGDSMRSTEYDTVSDRYARFLEQEILPEVGRKYNLRQDAYSRAIAGDSSGAIAAFNAAWQRPDLFSRVLSRIGTYTSIQWQPGIHDGGNIFPFLIRKSPRKNIRAWLSDGADDLESEHGSWPLQNLQMANSLKMASYDFHFSFGPGSHNGAQGNAEAPAALTWLWRDYDPLKTSQVYEQEPAEKEKPYFRVRVINRE